MATCRGFCVWRDERDSQRDSVAAANLSTALAVASRRRRALWARMIALILTFVLAGTVKGVTGMGLPTVTMGLLGLMMAPAQAAALLIIPSLATNIWQFAVGPDPRRLLRRNWPMLAAMALATVATAGLMTGAHAAGATLALGAVLMIYGLMSLLRIRFAVPRGTEFWVGPLAGAVTGVLTGATGVFVIPAAPYLQAIGLEKEDLVQALGLSFTVSTLGLAAGLLGRGAFHLDAAGASLLCTAPALLGVAAGQWLRDRIDPETFRRVFFCALFALGADLALRAVL